MPPKKQTLLTPQRLEMTEKANPESNQILQLLQKMQHQMDVLGAKIESIEKESEAAREAGESIEEIENVESAKKSVMRSKQKLREARRKVKVEAKDVFDEPSIGGANEIEIGVIRENEAVVMKIAQNVKTILAMMGTTKSSVESFDHTDYCETLTTAFETAIHPEIVSNEESTWSVFAKDEKNGIAAFVQQKVMISVLQATLPSKSPAKVKFSLAKRKDPNDGRAMFLAVRDAAQLGSSKMTRRKLRRKIKECRYEKGDNYDEFVDKIERLFGGYARLEDEQTGKSLAMTEDEKVDVVMDKLIESDPAWQDILDSALLSYEQSLNEFTMGDLYTRVTQKLDLANATGTQEGRVTSQEGRTRKP